MGVMLNPFLKYKFPLKIQVVLKSIFSPKIRKTYSDCWKLEYEVFFLKSSPFHFHQVSTNAF